MDSLKSISMHTDTEGHGCMAGGLNDLANGGTKISSTRWIMSQFLKAGGNDEQSSSDPPKFLSTHNQDWVSYQLPRISRSGGVNHKANIMPRRRKQQHKQTSWPMWPVQRFEVARLLRFWMLELINLIPFRCYL